LTFDLLTYNHRTIVKIYRCLVLTTIRPTSSHCPFLAHKPCVHLLHPHSKSCLSLTKFKSKFDEHCAFSLYEWSMMELKIFMKILMIPWNTIYLFTLQVQLVKLSTLLQISRGGLEKTMESWKSNSRSSKRLNESSHKPPTTCNYNSIFKLQIGPNKKCKKYISINIINFSYRD